MPELQKAKIRGYTKARINASPVFIYTKLPTFPSSKISLSCINMCYLIKLSKMGKFMGGVGVLLTGRASSIYVYRF